MQELEDAKAVVNAIYGEGQEINHKKYGYGTIKSKNGSNIFVDFSDVGQKQLGVFMSVINGIISINSKELDTKELDTKVNEYRELLKKESLIKTTVSYAEKEFAPYAEYLE